MAVDGTIEGKREIEEYKLDVSEVIRQMRWAYGGMLAILVVSQIWKLWRTSGRKAYAIADAFLWVMIVFMGLFIVFLPSLATVSLPVEF